MSRKAIYLPLFASAYLLIRAAMTLYVFLEVDTGAGADGQYRIANVRALPEGAQEAALRHYVGRARKERPSSRGKDVILIAGDSQLYGYFLPVSKTVAAYLSQEISWASVRNASRLSGTYGWAQVALEHAIDQDIVPRVLVVNANPAIHDDGGQWRNDQFMPGSLYLSLLRTTETLGITAESIRSRLRGGPPTLDLYDVKARPPGNGDFQVAALERSYYPQALPQSVAHSLRSLLEYSRIRVDVVVVVASPHHYAPYNEAPYRYGWDTAPIVRESMALCARYAHAACLDLSTAFGREYFHDVVHLNEAGHRRLAAEIAAAIRSRLGEAGPVSR